MQQALLFDVHVYGCGFLHVEVFRWWFQVWVRELHMGGLLQLLVKRARLWTALVSHMHTWARGNGQSVLQRGIQISKMRLLVFFKQPVPDAAIRCRVICVHVHVYVCGGDGPPLEMGVVRCSMQYVLERAEAALRFGRARLLSSSTQVLGADAGGGMFHGALLACEPHLLSLRTVPYCAGQHHHFAIAHTP